MNLNQNNLSYYLNLRNLAGLRSVAPSIRYIDGEEQSEAYAVHMNESIYLWGCEMAPLSGDCITISYRPPGGTRFEEVKFPIYQSEYRVVIENNNKKIHGSPNLPLEISKNPDYYSSYFNNELVLKEVTPPGSNDAENLFVKFGESSPIEVIRQNFVRCFRFLKPGYYKITLNEASSALYRQISNEYPISNPDDQVNYEDYLTKSSGPWIASDGLNDDYKKVLKKTIIVNCVDNFDIITDNSYKNLEFDIDSQANYDALYLDSTSKIVNGFDVIISGKKYNDSIFEESKYLIGLDNAITNEFVLSKSDKVLNTYSKNITYNLRNKKFEGIRFHGPAHFVELLKITNNENGYALVDLRGCVFSNCTFDGVSFGTQYVDYLILDGCKFSGCTFNSCEFYFSPQNVSFVQCNIIGSKSASGFFNFNKSNGNIIIGCNFANVVDPIKFTNFSYTISQITEEHDHRNNIILFNSISRNNFINSNSAFISVNGENSFNYLSNFSGNMVMSNYVAESMGSFFSIRSASAYANLISNNVSASSGEIIILSDELTSDLRYDLFPARMGSSGVEIQYVPILGAQAIDWYQGSNYGIHSQFSGFDILLWLDGRVNKIPGAIVSPPSPSGAYSTCAVCTLGSSKCNISWDEFSSFYKRYQLGASNNCGSANISTLIEVRNQFKTYFDIDRIIKNQSRYRPDWINVFLKGGSEPLWWPTSIPDLSQWAILADDGLTDFSIGLAINPLEEYKQASIKYKTRLIGYLNPMGWIELNPEKYPYAINMYGEKVLRLDHGTSSPQRTIFNDDFIDLISKVHAECALLGMDRDSGYGICGVSWDAQLLSIQLDFSDSAKAASGIDTSVDFPFPMIPGSDFYNFVITEGTSNGNVATLLLKNVNDAVGWTQAVKTKLEQYMYALRSKEFDAMYKIRKYVDDAGYSDFVILPGIGNTQFSLEWPLNGEESLFYANGSKSELGISGVRYRKQPSGITNKSQRDCAPDWWLMAHTDALLNQSRAGKRQYLWQPHLGIIYYAYNGLCGSDIANCMTSFDGLYNQDVQFKTYILPREMAVRGWMETQSLLALTSYNSIEFMNNVLDWHKFDDPENISGFENIGTAFSVQHLPYMRRIFSILGSIRESNVVMNNRKLLTWCLIMHRPESAWRSNIYNGYASDVFSSYYWPIFGAVHTCVENGVPHAIVHDKTFRAIDYSSAGVLIIPFKRSELSQSVLDEISNFNGLVIWMQDEFENGSLIDNFHNTAFSGSLTNAQISRNKLWDFMQAAIDKLSISIIVEKPTNLIDEPKPLVGYEYGNDKNGNSSIIANILADASWHDLTKAYLFDLTSGNDPSQGIDYCGRQNLLLDQPNSMSRIEEVASSLGLRKIMDNCGECSNRDCFYLEYSGADPIPVEKLPARGKLTYYAGYPPVWDSLRSSSVSFSSLLKPSRVRQLILNKDSGRFDPIDYFVNSNSFNLIPFEIGSVVQFQLKNTNDSNRDLGICINSSLFRAKNHLQLSALFSSIASNSNAVNLVKVKLKCGTTVREIEIAGNIIFNELSNHAFNNPSFYEWINNDPCGFAAPSDYAPIGFMFADSTSCASGNLSVSGMVIQNEGICNIALSLPSLRADALAISEVPCSCGSDRPSKFYSSRASISLDYTPQDGSLWAAQLDQELLNSASNIDGLLLFIKPDADPASRYYNVDANGLPFYKGIINYLDDIGSAILQHTNGAKSIYDYYYGLVLDFAGNFDINNNSPHPRYCAYPNAISILNTDALANTQREIANINGAYIDLIREIKFAYSNMKVAIRGIGQFGNGLSLEANLNDPTEYSLLDSVAEVRLGLQQRVSESYGPIIEKCDFIYVQNDNTIRGDSYNISVIRTNVMISSIRNHFVYVNGVCPEIYVEVNGLYTGSQDVQNENYCEINSDEIIVESVASFYKYGINGFVYNAVQETVAKEIFGNCPIGVNNNEYYQKLISCWVSQPYLAINPNYLTLTPYRYMNLSGQTSVYLGDIDGTVSTIRREYPYTVDSYKNISLNNTGKSTFIFTNNIYLVDFVENGNPSYSAYGMDLNYPAPLELEYLSVDGIHSEWSENPRLLDINKSYLFFLNDPYPNSTFENFLLDGSSAFQAKPLHYKYAVYDELNNYLLDKVENKISIVASNFCVYLNENNNITFKMAGKVESAPVIMLDKHFGVCWQVNFWYPLVMCSISLQHYLDYVSPSLQGSNSGFAAYFNDSFDINMAKINYFAYASYHAINTGRDIFTSYNDVRFLSSQEEINNYAASGFSHSIPIHQPYNSVAYEDFKPVSMQGTKYETHYNYFNNYINSLPITSESNLYNNFNGNAQNVAIIGNLYDVIGESGLRNFIIGRDNIKSIKCRYNCFVTLNSEGSITITYQPGMGYGDFKYYSLLVAVGYDFDTIFSYTDAMVVHYGKNEIENNFWVDENGLVSYLENKDFIDFEIYGDHVQNNLPSLTYIYALHKNGKLYARELNTTLKGIYSDRLICRLSVPDSLVGGVGLYSISVGDKLFVSAHDPRMQSGSAKNYVEEDNTARWEVIAIDYANGYAVLECGDAYAGKDVNYKRPFKIYVNDILRKVGSFDEFMVSNKYFENSWYSLGVTGIPSDPFDTREPYPEDMKNSYKNIYNSKIKKINPLSEDGITINPEFMSLSNNPFLVDNVGYNNRIFMCLVSPENIDYITTSDPHKKIFLWENEARVSKTVVLSPTFENNNRTVLCAVPRVNGVLQSLQMSMQQIGRDNKVLKIISNNTTIDDVYYGVAPIFVIKTNEQKNEQFSNEEGVFYSYSYELCIFDPVAVWNDPLVDFNRYSILNKYKKEKVFGYMADGYYSQIGWRVVDNINFNQNFYDNFIQKSVYAEMTAPEGFDKYYCPIRCGSTGIKSLVLLNNDGDCCVINSHVIPYSPSNQNNINYKYRNAVRGFNDYALENVYFDLRPFRQYWLYNRGPGFPQMTSGVPYGGLVEFHQITFVHRNVYKNANDTTPYSTPFIYEIADNSLVSPIVHENSVYGLGNTPSDLNHPFGIGLDSQQLSEFKTFSYTGASSINDISKDGNYIEVISYVNFDDDGLIMGKDAVIFRVKKDSGFKIDMAKVDNFNLYIYYSNGTLDAANMGVTNWTHPITVSGKTYYGLNVNIYEYIIYFNIIMKETMASVVPAFLRNPVSE